MSNKRYISGASMDTRNGRGPCTYRLCNASCRHYMNTYMINITDTGPHNSNHDQSSTTSNKQGHHREPSSTRMTPEMGSADMFRFFVFSRYMHVQTMRMSISPPLWPLSEAHEKLACSRGRTSRRQFFCSV